MLNKRLVAAILAALMFSPVILPPNNFFPVSVACANNEFNENMGLSYQITKGKEYLRLGNYKEALKYFKKAVEINPANEDALFCLGYTHGALKHHNRAAKFFKKVTKINPNNHRAFNNLGVAYALTGNYSKGRRYFKKATELVGGSVLWSQFHYAYARNSQNATSMLNKIQSINRPTVVMEYFSYVW